MEMVKRRNVSGLALLGMALMMGVFCGFSAPMANANETSEGAQCYRLDIQGMTCDQCAVHVQKTLAKVSGVAEAHVNFPKHEAVVCTKSSGDVHVDSLIAAVKKAGYKATLKK